MPPVKVFPLLLLLLSPASVAAHGERVPFLEWGGYPAATARCQRTVLAATLRCARTAWSIRRRCLADEAAGMACDRVATNAAIVTARRRALDRIDRVCLDRHLGEIGFLGQFDLQSDVIAGCRDWDVMLRSAVYEPRAATDPLCLATLDREITRAGVQVLARWERVMHRLAARSFAAAEKERVADRERARQARIAQRAGVVVAAACDDADILARRATRVVEMALCPLAQVCVQDGVECPEPVCGNGIIEPGELCDDGRAEGEDPCRAGCG